MPNNVWTGALNATSQVDTYTVGGTAANGQVYSITRNGKTVSYTASGVDTNTTIATALYSALSASTIAEFQEFTWANPSNGVITATAVNAGVPATFSSTATGTGTLTRSSAAGQGPNDVSLAGNWSAGWTPQGACSVPVQSNAVLASGGSLSNGTTYYWVITATNQNGETTVSNEKSLTADMTHGTGTLTWAQVNGATGYKIYRSTSSGTYGATSLVTTISSGSTLTYNDTGAATTTGTPPGVNGAVGDDVYLRNSSVSLQYNLAALAAIQPNSWNVLSSFTGDVGLPNTNQTGGYYEDRQKYLQLLGVVSALNVGAGSGGGSGRLKFDFQSTASVTVNVYSTGTPAEDGLYALLLKGLGTSSVVNVVKGWVDVAYAPGDTATVATLRMSYQTSQASDAQVRCGSGVSLTTIDQAGGVLEVNSAFTTLVQTGGTCVAYGTGAMTTVDVEKGGTFYDCSTGTITTLLVTDKSVYSRGRDNRAKTITNKVSLYAGSSFLDPWGVVTLSGGFQTINCGVDDVTADFGINRSYTVA